MFDFKSQGIISTQKDPMTIGCRDRTVDESLGSPSNPGHLHTIASFSSLIDNYNIKHILPILSYSFNTMPICEMPWAGHVDYNPC